MTLVTALIVALSFFATLALSQGLRINHLELQLEDERERTRTLLGLLPSSGVCGNIALWCGAGCIRPTGHEGLHESAKGALWEDNRGYGEQAALARRKDEP